MTASEAFQERIFTPLGLTEHLAAAAAGFGDPRPAPAGLLVRQQHLDHRHLRPAGGGPAAGAGRNPAAEQRDRWPTRRGDGPPAGRSRPSSDMKTYVEALVDGGLLDARTQKIRMDSIRPTRTRPSRARSTAWASPSSSQLYGHDGQIPGYMTFMGHDPDDRPDHRHRHQPGHRADRRGLGAGDPQGAAADLLPEYRAAARPGGGTWGHRGAHHRLTLMQHTGGSVRKTLLTVAFAVLLVGCSSANDSATTASSGRRR